MQFTSLKPQRPTASDLQHNKLALVTSMDVYLWCTTYDVAMRCVLKTDDMQSAWRLELCKRRTALSVPVAY